LAKLESGLAESKPRASSVRGGDHSQPEESDDMASNAIAPPLIAFDCQRDGARPRDDGRYV